MKTVLVFGTFDILHPGHRWFLSQAASRGDRIIAAVSRDRFVLEWKGKSPSSDEKTRRSALIESGLVDDAVLSDPAQGSYDVLERIAPDIICLGHDQSALKDDLEAFLDKREKSEKPDKPEKRPLIVVLRPWKRSLYSSSRLNRRRDDA